MHDPDILTWHLPDPERQPEFYRDVAMKRAAAFAIDTVLILVAALIVALMTLGVGLLLFAPLWIGLNFLIRAASLARFSATPGMMLMAIEFRTSQGARLDANSAMIHTAALIGSFIFLPLQLISMVLMAGGPRGQGLSDLALGTVVLNRRARS